MKLPRGVVEKGGRLFGRIHMKGGEYSIPLGPASDPGPATQRYYTARALAKTGTKPGEIRQALGLGVDLGAIATPKEEKPDPTVSEAVERWLSEKVRLDLSPDYGSDIESRVRRAFLPFLGDRPLRSVRAADCWAYKAHVRKTMPDIGPTTVGHYMRNAREFLNWAVDVQLLDLSPWPPKKIIPRGEKGPVKRLTEEEVEFLITLPEPWGFGLRLALYTGCRWGELVRLERTDLTPDGQLLIRKAKDKEPRTVPIPGSLLKEIMARKGRLFVTRHGKPYSEQSAAGFAGVIRRRAAKRLKQLPQEKQKALAGLASFHIHKTRHTYASRFVEAGGSLAMLAEILGHTTVRMTQRYARPNERAVRADAAQVFARWGLENSRSDRESAENRGLAVAGSAC